MFYSSFAVVKKREFFVLQDYTSESTEIDEATYKKVHHAMTKAGIAIYRTGESYKVLVPHSILFNNNSSNFNPHAKKIINLVKKWLSFYAINEVHYTAMYLPEDLGGISKKAIARKQTTTLANEISKEKPLANVETINTEAYVKSKHLPFWQNMRLILKSKSPSNSASIIEFTYNR